MPSAVARMKRMTLRSNCWVIASRYNWKFRQRKSFSAGSERMSASPGRLQVFQSRRRIRGSPYTAFDRLGPFLLRPHSSIWLTEIPTMVSELISVIRFRGLSFQFRNAEKLRASIPASRGSGEIWRARRVRPSIEIRLPVLKGFKPELCTCQMLCHGLRRLTVHRRFCVFSRCTVAKVE